MYSCLSVTGEERGSTKEAYYVTSMHEDKKGFNKDFTKRNEWKDEEMDHMQYRQAFKAIGPLYQG